MLRVALTGNAASGKSTVLDLFRRWGAATTDADELARRAVEPGTPGLRRVAERFGPDLLQPDGTLDRAALRRRAMGDPTERAALNAIVHPEVARLAAEAEAGFRAAGQALVIHDIPLLFEVLDPADYDAVVLVDAPEAARRGRLRARGLDDADVEALLAAQQPPETKRARSHFVIDNGGSRLDLEARSRNVWNELLKRAAVA